VTNILHTIIIFPAHLILFDLIILKIGSEHNKELNHLHSSTNTVQVIKSRRIRLAGHVALMGEKRCVYRDLVVKPEGKRPSGRHSHRREDNIKMDLQEVECEGMDWIVQLRVGTVGGQL
jgi:hypothetical protein